MIRTLALSALATLGACSVSDGLPRSGDDSSPIQDLARAVKDKDVVFLAEQHNHDTLHDQYRRFLEALYEERPDLVVSMEMFDRDDQDAVDAYLQSALSEESFREEAKLWYGYDAHYRPIVEFCKEKGLPLLASNLPIELARRMTKEGPEALRGEEFMPTNLRLDDEAEFADFAEALGDVEGHGGPTLKQMFPAQVARDESMAETIDRYLASVEGASVEGASVEGASVEGDPAGGKLPLVVHVVGAFHVQNRRGTYARLAARRPDFDMVIVGTEITDTILVGGPSGEDYRLLVPEQPPKSATSGAIGRVDDAASAETDEDGQETDNPHRREPDASDRPALGFRPGYDAAVTGVLIESLRPDGPAERAGLLDGDVITRLGGTVIEVFEDYNEALNVLVPGDKVTVEVLRGTDQKTFEVLVGSR